MNKNKCLVSIIIPAYNVQNYIKKCVESVCLQTYDNIEIIVVDDGSTDKTGLILEGLQKNDSRVKILKQNNVGVSAARNAGLRIASGEYVAFIDGDDYVSNRYIEYLLSIIKKTKTDFSFSYNCYTQADEEQIGYDIVKKITKEKAIADILSQRVIVGCWNKIYRRSFLIENNLFFSENLFYGEGLSYIIVASDEAEYVGTGLSKHYYYRRNNELSATSKFDIKKLRNGEKALYKIKKSISLKNSKLINESFSLHMALYCIGAMVRLYNNKLVKTYQDDYYHWKRELRKHLRTVIFSKNVSLYRKLLVLSGTVSPSFLALLDSLRRKRIVKKSVK